MIQLPILTLLSFLVFAAVPVGAQDVETGKEAAWRGDYATALAELRPLAEQGNAEAQYGLANLYRDGRGVPRDDEQAAVWYQRAAAAGSWSAAFDLGMLYWGQSQNADTQTGAPNEALVRVHMWFGIAAATENGGCVSVSGPLRDAVAQSMTAPQIASAEERTRIWLAEYKTTDVNVAAAKPTC